MAYIEFKNISKSYGDNEVLSNIDLNIEKGQMVTLLGPSGCGKSTLLRCLAGLETVSNGQIFLDGKEITNMNPKDREIGMVFQQYSLFPNLSIEENVAFGLKLKKLPRKEIKKKVDKILDIVGLSEKKKQYPSSLSGGQQQRAALARAIVTEPKVLLLDEPLSAIDALLRRSLQMEIRKIQKELDITAIFVTHDQDEAMVISDEIHLMYQGQIEQSATPATMYTNPVSCFAASFIGNYNLMSAEEFEIISGERIGVKNIAFRPEIVELSEESNQKVDAYHCKGTIKMSIPHGNILRYEVKIKGLEIKADVLFAHMRPLETETECYISIPKDQCILLER